MKHKSLSRSHRAIAAFVVGLSLVGASCGSDDETATTDAPNTTAQAADTSTASSATETTAAPTESTGAAETSAPSETSTDSAAPAETTSPAAEADKSPVLIAGLIDATGPSAGNQGDVPAIAEAWGDYVNANGGLNGHPVTFEFADTAGDAAKAQSQVTELAAKNPVAFLLVSSSAEAAVADALGATGVPVIGVGYSASIWGGSIAAFKLDCSTDEGAAVSCALPNAFPIATTVGAVVDEQVLGAQAAGATKLAVAACAEVEACSQAEPIFAADTAALGLEYGGLVKVSSTAADYTAECIKFVQDNVDFVQISATANVGVKMWADCQDQGYTGIFGASAGTVSGDLIKVDGITLAGGINAFPWWVDDAPVQEYRDVMAAAGLAEDKYSNPTMTGVWSVLQLFAKANENMTDNPTKDETLAAMYTIKDETLGGLIAPVTFTEGELAASRPCFWPYMLKDGEFTNPLGGLKYQCYPPES